MFPYLFPWPIPGPLLDQLAYVAAGVVAVIVAFWSRSSAPKKGVGRIAVPVAISAAALYIGVRVVRAHVPFETQPLPFHLYGVFIATAFVLAIYLAAREGERSGYVKKSQVQDMSFWALIFSLVGSRVLFIIVGWGGPDGYGANPLRILEVWTGGLVFYGGFIGAALASYVYARRQGIDFRVLADVCIPSVSLGHFFGRLGCISAGCCWGKACETGFPFGIRFPPGALAYDTLLQDPAFQAYITTHGTTPPLHPTQLYEAFGELALFFALLVVRRGKRFHGQVLATWVVLYALLRLSIEGFRGDWLRGMILRWPEANPVLLSTSQVVAFGMLALGAVLFVVWRPARQPALLGT